MAYYYGRHYILVLLLLTGLCLVSRGQTNCTPSLSTGLKAWLPLDESTGTVAADATGQLTLSQLSNGGVWHPAEGITGGGALELPEGAVLNIPLQWTPTTYSIAWWIKPGRRFDWSQAVGAGWGAFLFHSTSSGAIYVGTDGPTRFYLSDTDLVRTGVWQQFVFTFDNGVAKFYKNGLLLASRTDMSMPAAWSGFSLGNSGDDYYDDLRVYDRAISAAEATALYKCPITSTTTQCSPLTITAPKPVTIEPSSATSLQVTAQQAGTALAFDGIDDYVIPDRTLQNVTNTFTVEAWVNPAATHEVDRMQTAGVDGVYNQRYLIFPTHGFGLGGADHAGMGISVGTNGVSVYEHSGDYMPPLLVWEGVLTGWTHIAVVYQDRRPYLFVNGQLVKTGLQSLKPYVHPSLILGGELYGYYKGQADEIRIWNTARTLTELQQYRNAPVSPTSAGLVSYWRFDEGQGIHLADASTSLYSGTLARGAYTSNGNWQNPTPTSTPTGPQWVSPSPLALNSDVTYTWSPATGLDQTTGPSVVASPKITTTYTVTATSSTSCASATAQVTVTVVPPPPVHNAPTQEVCTALGGIVPAAVTQAPADMNYVRTYIPRVPLTESNVTGSILREQWTNVTGGVSAIPLNTQPNSKSYLPSLEGPTNTGINNYGDRIRGYLSPTQTGNYTFWIAGDDNCELWLSLDDNPATKRRIATVPDWTNAREWNKFTGPGQQKSVLIPLMAGRRYYLETLHHQGGGGDNLAVAWQREDDIFEGPIPGSYLSPADAVPTGWTVEQAQVKTEYLDGLGRPVQQVLWQESPSKRDLIQPIAYDKIGRQNKTYLPYIAGSSVGQQGSYHANALREQDDFYRSSQSGPGNIFDNIARTGVAYSEQTFEASPLSRVRQQGAPGEAYGLNGGHPVNLSERPNTADDQFLQFTSDYATPRSNLTTVGAYAVGTLWVQEVQDENGARTQQVTDKQGQLICKQVEAGGPSGTLGGLQSEYNTFTLTAPAGTVFTGIQRALYGTGSGNTAETFALSCGADVTTQIQQLVAAQLADPNPRVITFSVSNSAIGTDPCPGVGKTLAVLATYGPEATATPVWLRTYYVYDELQRLQAVIPPKAVTQLLTYPTKQLTNAEEPLLFRYRYDGRGRQLAKQVPGQDGEMQLVYDQLDRPVLSQDAAQRQRQEWSWTKYDALGRPILTGLLTRNATATQLQAEADAVTEQYEQRTTNGPHYYSTGRAYPTLDNGSFTGVQVLTVKYYDDYNFDNDLDNRGNGTPDASFTAYSSQFLSGQAPIADNRVIGLVTRTKTRVLGVSESSTTDAPWLITTTFYDEQTRPIQIVNINARGGQDIVTRQVDFAGNVLKSYSVHQGPNHEDILVSETSVYDHTGRLQRTTQQLGTETPVTLANYTYNELGQVVAKVLSPDQAVTRQEVNFSYTSRGWLKGINEDLVTGSTSAASSADLWGMQLSYECGFQLPQYNGNISGQKWRSQSDGVARAYGYRYDSSNRLLQADYVAQTNTNTWTAEQQHYGLTNVRYDENGNIVALQRRGLLAQATRRTPKQYGVVDDLAYAYVSTQGNKLQAVEDRVTDNALPQVNGSVAALTSLAGDFQEKAHASTEYSYDSNGNLTADTNKGITSIAYNYLNLPTQINFSAQDYIEFRYTASGQKVAKFVHQMGQAVRRTDYLGAYQYEADSLRAFPHEEGRVLRSVSAISGQVRYVREYTLKDHLGNLRVAYRPGDPATYWASMEPERAQTEEAQFDQASITATRFAAGSLARTPTVAGGYVARLNAAEGKPLGPLKLLSVHKGDVVEVLAPGYAAQAVRSNSSFTFSLISFVTTLLQQPAAPVGDPGTVKKKSSLPFLGFGLGLVPQLSQNGQVPKGYVRALVFNQDSVLLPAYTQTQQLSAAALSGYEEMKLRVQVPQDGYVQVYVGNEGDADVYFDDVQIDYKPGLLVQENQYDPWGLNLAGINRRGGTPENQYQYGEKERQTDFNLNWSDHNARFYDAQLGRWHVGDLMAEGYESHTPYNYVLGNPINMSDPFGTDTVSAGSLHNNDNWEKFDSQNDVAQLSEVTVTGSSQAEPEQHDAENQGNKGVGQPGLAESLIPVWGNGRSAIDHFQNGNYWRGAGYTAMAISDVFLVKAGVTAIIKGGVLIAAEEGATNLWKVGKYNELRGLEASLDAHHVGQKAVMKRLVTGYDWLTGPSILVPKIGHTQRAAVGIVSRATEGFTSARQLLARDIFELRRVYPQIPNEALKELIELNKTMYPGAFLK